MGYNADTILDWVTVRLCFLNAFNLTRAMNVISVRLKTNDAITFLG